MEDINLLKNELQNRPVFSLHISSRVPFYVVGGILVLEFLIYGGLFFYEKHLAAETLAVEQKAAAIDFEIGKYDNDRLEAISFQERLKNLQIVFGQHLYWTKALKELERVTYKMAVYGSVQVDESAHKFVLSGSVPSYTDMAKLMLGFKESPYVTDVALQASSQDLRGEAGYAFNLEVTFDPKLLVQK